VKDMIQAPVVLSNRPAVLQCIDDAWFQLVRTNMEALKVMHVHVCVRVRVMSECVYVCVRERVCVRVYASLLMYVCMYACMHVCMYV
jgi:hypothetical protein